MARWSEGNVKPFPLVKQYELALILLHESGHVQDKRSDRLSYYELEKAVYLWFIRQSANLLATDVDLLRNLVAQELRLAVRFIQSAGPNRPADQNK